MGFDRDSYQECYKKILEPVIEEYRSADYGVEVRPDADKIIWKNYAKFNRHCREEYMKNPEKLTDRHKVAACYIYAILKSDILSCSLSKQLGDEKNLLLNERLAVCFGMTLLRALIRGNAKEIKDSEIKKKLLEIFNGELDFPKTNHGEYRENLYMQLYHTKKEGNYNILALADSLFYVECYNLIKNGIPEDIFKKK